MHKVCLAIFFYSFGVISRVILQGINTTPRPPPLLVVTFKALIIFLLHEKYLSMYKVKKREEVEK